MLSRLHICQSERINKCITLSRRPSPILHNIPKNLQSTSLLASASSGSDKTSSHWPSQAAFAGNPSHCLRPRLANNSTLLFSFHFQLQPQLVLQRLAPSWLLPKTVCYANCQPRCPPRWRLRCRLKSKLHRIYHATKLILLRQVQSPCAKVTVGKGPTQRTFYIHKPVLEAKSEFFRACLNGNFVESENEGRIELPDDDPEVFGYVARWLYGRPARVKEGVSPVTLVDFYVFADKLMNEDLKNQAMDMLQEYHEGAQIKMATLQRLVDRNLKECNCMSYLVRQAAHDMVVYGNGMWAINNWEDFLNLGPEITKRVVEEIQSLCDPLPVVIDDPSSLRDCQYHEHPEGVFCSSA